MSTDEAVRCRGPGVPDGPTCGGDCEQRGDNHCTTDGSVIEIKIDRINEWDTKHCVRPGITQLGTTSQIRNAWYTGKLC
ncbi:DUF6355 family natural product biosynthesis protein [Streptomyces sp. NPDC058274]|uniref:DUF6355 family natural product biosynthesis protein n=1 Tax=Streptomyces sp. NPDC058274 TaxID=3346416 RepID=UPI0036E404D1